MMMISTTSVAFCPRAKCEYPAYLSFPFYNFAWFFLLSSLSSGSPPSRRSSVDTSLFISVVAKRREEIRRQRIESEQRRRDELRDGYRKLKEVLPASNQKSSKVSLLDRGK